MAAIGPELFEQDSEEGYVQTSEETHADGTAKRVHVGYYVDHPFESLPEEFHTEQNAKALATLIGERYPNAQITDPSHLYPGPYYTPVFEVEYCIETEPGEDWPSVNERIVDDPEHRRFRNDTVIMWTFRDAYLEAIGLDPLRYPAPNQPAYEPSVSAGDSSFEL